jgi:hypothetical protein
VTPYEAFEQLDAAITSYVLGDVDGSVVSRTQHRLRSALPTPTGAVTDAAASRRCPACRSPWVVCAAREGTIGSFCCGDCTVHGGNHQWPARDRTTQPEELA